MDFSLRREEKQSITVIIMTIGWNQMAFGKNETATHLWMCGSYHPVPFVTISSNMKDPSSHLGGLICSLAMGAGLSGLELQWWRRSLLFFFTQCQIKTVAQQLELIWIRLLWHFERRSNWKAFNFLSMTYCGESLGVGRHSVITAHTCESNCLYVHNVPALGMSFLLPLHPHQLYSLTLTHLLIHCQRVHSLPSLSFALQTFTYCSRFGTGVAQCELLTAGLRQIPVSVLRRDKIHCNSVKQGNGLMFYNIYSLSSLNSNILSRQGE